MNELFAHLIGDYILQNHWMAVNKTKSTFVAYIHAVFYTLPFLLLTHNITALALILLTHTYIDRYRLAVYINKIRNWEWKGDGFPEGTPSFLSVWLTIIADNTMHLLINHFALALR